MSKAVHPLAHTCTQHTENTKQNKRKFLLYNITKGCHLITLGTKKNKECNYRTKFVQPKRFLGKNLKGTADSSHQLWIFLQREDMSKRMNCLLTTKLYKECKIAKILWIWNIIAFSLLASLNGGRLLKNSFKKIIIAQITIMKHGLKLKARAPVL